MDRDELAAWLRLLMAPGIGAATARRLMAALGLPQQVLAAPDEALASLLTPKQTRALREAPAGLAAQVEATQAWLAGDPGHRRVVTLADAAYPASLLETADPPLVLWVEGERIDEPWPEAIAVVGSRNPTPQGAENARGFSRSLAEAGWTVVSGLALGVDTAAHEGALEGSAPPAPATIAVVGTGLDRAYPARNAPLARRIARRGRLVSEYPLGTPPLADNFPRRNRVIAGLSRGTLVVEAALRSGSLITARCAVEQGREVFAVPGSIHSPQARGCHRLIRQGAKLVETAQDVLEELAPCLPASAPGGATTAPAATVGTAMTTATAGAAPVAAVRPARGDALLEALGFDPCTLDTLCARTGLPTPELQARLLELELQGEVARLPGGLFQRVGSA